MIINDTALGLKWRKWQPHKGGKVFQRLPTRPWSTRQRPSWRCVRRGSRHMTNGADQKVPACDCAGSIRIFNREGSFVSPPCRRLSCSSTYRTRASDLITTMRICPPSRLMLLSIHYVVQVCFDSIDCFYWSSSCERAMR